MDYKVEIVEKISRNGSPYMALEITFPSGYKKLVFLTPAEKHLVQVCQ